MRTKIKVLFICIHNSARSQIAEALLKKYTNDKFNILSGGFEPKKINPLAIEALKEEGIDISKNSSHSLFEYLKEGKLFNYIITVCDEANAQKCPIFPGMSTRIHWSFEDPSSFEGTEAEKLQKTIAIKDAIKKNIIDFIKLVEKKTAKKDFPPAWKVH